MNIQHAERLITNAAKTTGLKRNKFVSRLYLATTNYGITKEKIGQIFDDAKKNVVKS